MSELIDKIFDIEKISGEVATILSELNKANNAITGFKDGVKSIETEIRKSKGMEELAGSSKKLNDEFTKAQKPLKDSATLIAELQAKTEALTGSEKAVSIEIAKARLELAAATKATKEAAIAEIELTAANKDASGSYNALKKDLKDATKEYMALSAAEANSAKGQELLKKINETQVALKKTDASMGNYQRNVGNYAGALDGLTPRLGGLAGTLLDIARAAKKSQDELNAAGGDNGLGIMAQPRIPAGLAKIMTGFKGIGQSVVAMGKAVLANPIVAVMAAIVFIFTQVKNAIGESEERTNKMNEAFARFKPILRTVGDLFEVIADAVIKYVEVLGMAYSAVIEFLGINPKGSADQFVKAEKMKQDAVASTRKLNEDAAKQETIIAEQRAIMADKESYSYAQRQEALKKAGAAEKQLAKDKLNISKINYNAILAESKLDDQDAAIKDKLSQAKINMLNADKESAGVRRKLGKEAQKLSNENQADLKAEADVAEATTQKIIAARRRLVDSQFALQKDSQEKQLALNAESLKRELEDTKASGELRNNLIKASEIEADKIRKEWKIKKLNDDIKADELTLQNMKSAGQSTLEFEKEILRSKMDAEILAGGEDLEVKRKYKYLELDLEADTAEKKAQLFEKQLTKDVKALEQSFAKKENALKQDYANGLMSKEDYEAELLKIQSDGIDAANTAAINSLKEQLNVANLSTDKKIELSNKLKDLEIANEKLKLDATIKAGEDKVKSAEDEAKKREEITRALADLTMQIFGEISGFAIAQSEEKIKGYEAELEASEAAFEKQQESLDNAIMSDETRAEKQIELQNEKEARDKVINDKIKAEKVKQAKWEKANAVVQAVIQTSLAVASALKTLNPALAIIAGIAGAIQVASILAQPIPAFAKGGTTGSGLALWGEERAEIAVTPSGQTFLAEKPTISNFDAGTKIYKSVSDYENFMAGKNSQSNFKIEYDKMPQNNIILDGNGLWGIVNKENSRRTLLNRRYKN